MMGVDLTKLSFQVFGNKNMHHPGPFQMVAIRPYYLLYVGGISCLQINKK